MTSTRDDIPVSWPGEGFLNVGGMIIPPTIPDKVVIKMRLNNFIHHSMPLRHKKTTAKSLSKPTQRKSTRKTQERMARKEKPAPPPQRTSAEDLPHAGNNNGPLHQSGSQSDLELFATQDERTWTIEGSNNGPLYDFGLETLPERTWTIEGSNDGPLYDFGLETLSATQDVVHNDFIYPTCLMEMPVPIFRGVTLGKGA